MKIHRIIEFLLLLASAWLWGYACAENKHQRDWRRMTGEWDRIAGEVETVRGRQAAIDASLASTQKLLDGCGSR